MIPRRHDRTVAALYLVPATVYLLYLGWASWGPLTREITEALSFGDRRLRGDMRQLLGDFRLFIEVLIVFAAAGLVERILAIFPRDDAH